MTQFDEFGFYDYKTPIGDKQDMRTSTYIGHKHIVDASVGSNLFTKVKELYPYNPDPTLEKGRVSDYRDSYVWKFADAFEIKNPTVAKKEYIKPYDELKFKFLKRPMRPATSSSHQDYVWHPKVEPAGHLPIMMETAVKTTPMVIDRSKPGYAKYLDPAATTYRLSYTRGTAEEESAGPAAQDHITFWNWNKFYNPRTNVSDDHPLKLCDGKPVASCPIRYHEYTSTVKYVPHKGLTTEVRENYKPPHVQEVEDHSELPKNSVVYTDIIPFTKKTEYDVYGSGERTELYV